VFEGQFFCDIIVEMQNFISGFKAAQSPDPDLQAQALILEHPEENPVDTPVEEKPAPRKKPPKAAKPVEEPPVEKPPLDVSEIIKIRQRTVNDLQEAYANGHQKAVFELLARFGNGAKSFRELTAESFVPIREAIDNGALK
jgi:hypothetical protein